MIIHPRLNDYHNLPLTQESADFAIPFLDEDIPLFLDPFLLWKSPSQADNSLHGSIVSSFNYLGRLFLSDKNKAVSLLIEMSECNEVGLGNSKTKHGKRIGKNMAEGILSVFSDIPQIANDGIAHFEELQLLIEGFSKDRVSDIACNLLKSYLIDYTIQHCAKHEIPMHPVSIQHFDIKKHEFISEQVRLPINPKDETPILLVPKRWLRFVPWINFDDYYKDYVATSQNLLNNKPIPRIEILEYNRNYYDQVQTYIKRKTLEQADCKNDPLFSQIPISSSKRKLSSILKLPSGKKDNANQKYENYLCPLLASMLYPELDFAQTQSRTDSGVLIRDLIFYNNTSHKLLNNLYEEYSCKQIVFELKNTSSLDTTHINQLNRYLSNEFGSFGIIFTRNKPPATVYRNTIALWAGQRRCILILDDSDLELMCQIYENKQRTPIDVINKKFIEFIRDCPS